jgi:hypothetical protein
MVVRMATTLALCALLASALGAQTSKSPGPTAPRDEALPIPKRGDNLVLNPTIDECRRGWRPGLKWSKKQFNRFCAQMKISK